MNMTDFMKLDLYSLLGVPSTATSKDIKTAYRKKALECHPDKNPDDPEAVKMFLQLSEVLKILLDETARGAYDKALKAREAQKARTQALDSERKRFKLDLDEREARAEQCSMQKTADELLQQQIERLRKQASKEIEEEVQRVHQMLTKQKGEHSLLQRRIQIRWKASKKDYSNGGYSEELLNDLFSKYGKIEALLVPKKNGRAIIEFSSAESAKRAYRVETGSKSNPLELKLLSGEPREESPVRIYPNKTSSYVEEGPLEDLEDMEARVFREMREAQARKNAASD